MRDARLALVQFMCEALTDCELVELLRGGALSREAPLGVPRVCGGGVTRGRSRFRR
jgi:hypothetical protein